MKKYLVFIFSILTLCTVTLSYAYTIRHVYNSSNATWYIRCDSCMDFDIGAPKNSSGFFILNPKTTYSSYFGYDPEGFLLICDSAKPFNCYNRSLVIDGNYIEHDGKTGTAFDVNRPANGDIRIHKDYLH